MIFFFQNDDIYVSVGSKYNSIAAILDMMIYLNVNVILMMFFINGCTGSCQFDSFLCSQ